jgi:hypothetical protein
MNNTDTIKITINSKFCKKKGYGSEEEWIYYNR